MKSMPRNSNERKEFLKYSDIQLKNYNKDDNHNNTNNNKQLPEIRSNGDMGHGDVET